MTNFFLISLVIHFALTYAPFQVDGLSMYPNLKNQEIFLIDKDDFRKEGLKRGNIIVFRVNSLFQDNNYFYVKRVIGLPGETVKIDKNGVYIKKGNNPFRLLNEIYLHNHHFKYGDERFFIVPPNSYFVLGDNRDDSKDSRYFDNPYISINRILGKYVWP